MHLATEQPATFQGIALPGNSRLAGLSALVRELSVDAPVRKPSCISRAHVRDSHRQQQGWTLYDKRYWPGDRITDHVGFALTHEQVDLLTLKRCLEAMDPAWMEAYVRATPTGTSTRRAWFFYETLTGRRLDLDDAGTVRAVDALDPRRYYTAQPRLSRRHRVRDNLLGDGGFTPIIRRTDKLAQYAQRDLRGKATAIVGRTRASLLARAASFLLLADSRASFAIEGERPPRSRLDRWGRAVLQAGKNPLRIEELVRLQSVLIEDTRFVTTGLRRDGVYLGERDALGDPLPEFIGARPEDLETLLSGLVATNERMREAALDPVLQATATAFGFVYIHPFEDGNGRVHRCLVHHVLAERGFAPPGMVFPVSSAMLDSIDDYRAVLQNHSGPLMPWMDWRKTPDGNVSVVNDTADLYRYFDCTEAAEFLYGCVTRTVEHDLPKEIDYLRRHDEMLRQVTDRLDMPDRVARNLIMFIRQNDGTLPTKRRRKEFAALTDEEVAHIESIYDEVFSHTDDEQRL